VPKKVSGFDRFSKKGRKKKILKRFLNYRHDESILEKITFLLEAGTKNCEKNQRKKIV